MDRLEKEFGEGAWTAVRRCLQAIADTEDFETKRLLWQAALVYAKKAREERAGLEVHAPLTGHAQAPGGWEELDVNGW